jgi:hypothetical protein
MSLANTLVSNCKIPYDTVQAVTKVFWNFAFCEINFGITIQTSGLIVSSLVVS